MPLESALARLVSSRRLSAVRFSLKFHVVKLDVEMKALWEKLKENLLESLMKTARRQFRMQQV